MKTNYTGMIVLSLLLSAGSLCGQAPSGASALSPVPAAGVKILPHRWFYLPNGLDSDAQLDKVTELLRTAAQHGYTGVMLDADFTNIPQWPADKLERVKKVKDICAQLKLDVVPLIMSAGYSNGILPVNRNLAEGLPVRDAVFQVKNGVANIVSDRPLAQADSRLETAVGDKAAGLDMQDEPGRITFVDKQVTHDGVASLRFEPTAGKGRARILKTFPNEGKHCLARFWVKGEGLTHMAICLYDGGRQVDWYPIEIGSSWKKIEYPVLTGDLKDARLYIGAWDAKRGKFWLSDLEIFDPGLVNILRRPGAPLTVRKEAGGDICVEGRDFAPVSDPQLKINQGYHTPPAIHVLPGGSIHDGDRLLVSYYVHPLMRKGQMVTCMSEPQTYDIWQKAVTKTWETVQPHYWFLDMDEVRCGGTCQACRDRKNADGTPMTSAQILGSCITRQFAMIRAACPDATVVMWSDMLDPNHNCRDDYYYVPGGYAGAWKYVPRDLVMCPWNLGCAKESFAFFENLGMRTVAGAYYDADTLDDSKKWLDLERAQPHGIGIGYITWESKYDLLPAFGDLVSSPSGAIPGVTFAPGAPAPSPAPTPTPAPPASAPTAAATDLLTTASPPANDPSWKTLFNGQNLNGWTIAKGTWQAADGCAVGSAAESEAGSRLDSDQTFGDCEITCRLYSDDCKFATVQLRDWSFNVRWPFEQMGAWRTFRLVSKGGVVQASLDGEPLKAGGACKQAGAGKIRIFVGNPYSIKIKDARVR